MATSNLLFEQIAQVWESSKLLTTKTKPESVYMTLRFISLDPAGIIPASEINRLQGLPPWATLPALKYATPTMKQPRNKYPKKLTQEVKLPLKKENGLKRLCDKFCVTRFHGLQIMQLLEAQGFKIESN